MILQVTYPRLRAWLLSMLLLSPVVSAAQQQLIILTSFSEPVSQQFKSAFERQYPDIEVRFINKKTSAALSHLEKGMKPVPDLFMASAVDAFEWLTERGLLLPYQAATATTPPSLPYVSFAHSGYGLMWNDDYLQRYRLQAPVAWNDLLDPGFHGHIGMSSPTRSGTTHVLVETLLQQRGWDAGWAYWLELAGNLATVTARSFGVRQGVLKERFGVGLVIDFFALSLQPRNPQIRLGYPAPTSVLPVCAALIRGASVPDNGRLFLRYLLSAQGQQVLLQPELSRYPIDGRILAGVPDHPLSRHQPLITERYDYDAQQSRLRYELVNALFDQLITFRLQELQHFWHRYHETAMRLADDSNPKWQADLARARELATTVPFSAEQLGDERLLGQFARYQPGIPLTSEQQRQQDRWRRESADRLEQALRLLRGIADRRAVQDATEEGAD